jgi:hypothetical protein
MIPVTIWIAEEVAVTTPEEDLIVHTTEEDTEAVLAKATIMPLISNNNK